VGLPYRSAGERRRLKGGKCRIDLRVKLAFDDLLDDLARDGRRRVLELH